MPRPLTPRAVAVQGIGYGVLWVALQGFWPTSPYRRAPRGPGFGARPTVGMRPAQMATSRPGQTNTTRPRRC